MHDHGLQILSVQMLFHPGGQDQPRLSPSTGPGEWIGRSMKSNGWRQNVEASGTGHHECLEVIIWASYRAQQNPAHQEQTKTAPEECPQSHRQGCGCQHISERIIPEGGGDSKTHMPQGIMQLARTDAETEQWHCQHHALNDPTMRPTARTAAGA